MLKFHRSKMRDKLTLQTSPVTSMKPDGTVMNPAFQDVDGLGHPAGGSAYGSYQTLNNENYPTRSVSAISPGAKGDYTVGRSNPGFLSDPSDTTGVHVYPERLGHYASKSVTRPEIKTPSLNASRRSYSPTEDREVPAYYTPVNSHRKLLRGEILYVTKDTRDHGRKCWKRCMCIGLVTVILVVAAVIGSLSATGILFRRSDPEKSSTSQVFSSTLSEGGSGLGIRKPQVQFVDIEVRPVESSQDVSGGQTSASRIQPANADMSSIMRQPKADVPLIEWRRQKADENLTESSASPGLVISTTTSTTSTASPANGKMHFDDGVPEAVEGELRITNMDFQSALTDHNTWIFQYTSNDLTVYMNDIFLKSTNGENYNATRIVSFRSGSVIVKYQALWNRAPDNWDDVVTKVINKHLDDKNNFLGNYLVDRGSVAVKSIFYTCRVNNGGCSHLCEFDLLVMRHYCLCPDNSYSLLNLTTCVPAGDAHNLAVSENNAVPPTQVDTQTITKTVALLPEVITTTVRYPSVAAVSPSKDIPVFADTQASTTSSLPISPNPPPDEPPVTSTTAFAPLTALSVTPTSPAIATTLAPISVPVGQAVSSKSISNPFLPPDTVTSTQLNLVYLPGVQLEILPSSHQPMANSTMHTKVPFDASFHASDGHVKVAPNVSLNQISTVTLATSPAPDIAPVEPGQFFGPFTATSRSASTPVTVTEIPVTFTPGAPSVTFSISATASPVTGNISHLFDSDATNHLLTTDNGRHDEDRRTTNMSTHLETDLQITNSTHVDVIIKSVPDRPSGEPAWLTLGKPIDQSLTGSLSCSKAMGEIICLSENRCMPALTRCNGVPECGDKSDESDCKGCGQNFQCKSGNCLPVGLVCDGIEDCTDGSDERGCSQDFCQSAGMFQCVAGYCLENSSRCDGLGDCYASYAMSLPVDEMNCFNSSTVPLCLDAGHFMCSQSRRCIPLSWRCNGRIDCLNSEDEKGCDENCDPSTSFKCDGGGCIANQYRCNGNFDCPDGYSDERDCLRLNPAGLLEVQYGQPEWRTVCSDNWDQFSGTAVCQQLGYRPAASTFSIDDPTNGSNIYTVDRDSNDTRPVLRQLRPAVSASCRSNGSRAAVTCEPFRCQNAVDPSIETPLKFMSAMAQITFYSDPFIMCHGYLVAPMWIVTSASCLANRNSSDFKVTFSDGAFISGVTEVFQHPLFLSVRMLHDRDFALLQLVQPVPSNIVPLCILTNATSTMCQLIKLNSNSTVAASPLEWLSSSDCSTKNNFPGLVSGSMGCYKSSQILCDDDAVSPMVCQTDIGKWEFRGFLSYQHHCGYFAKKPLVMANLTFAVDWMRSVIGPSLYSAIPISVTAPAVGSNYSVSAVSLVKDVATNSSAIPSLPLPDPAIELPPSNFTEITLPGKVGMKIIILPSNATAILPDIDLTLNGSTTYTNFTSTASPHDISIPMNMSATSAPTTAVVNVNYTTTDIPASSAFSSHGLTCPDGAPLLLEFMCDNIIHCTDGWDERMDNCLNVPCHDDRLRCGNGRCIAASAKCDGRAQCPVDATDEHNCRDCDPRTHYQCPRGRCIPNSWMCDGETDCDDGSDETADRCIASCENTTEAFRCRYGGGCIPNTQVCNGISECPDSSDESSCIRFRWSNESSVHGIVDIRTRGSQWTPICLDSLIGKQKQWSSNICANLGFDFATAVGPVIMPNTSGFTLDNGGSAELRIFMAVKNTTNQCNNSEVVAAGCGFQARGDWNKNVTDRDYAVAYDVPQDEYRHIVLLIHVKGDLEPCIGTILSAHWLITSYECISEADSTLMPVDWIVSTDPDTVDDNSLRFVRRFVAHPSIKFGVYFSRHDLVLVELTEDIDLASGVNKAVWPARRPITIPSTCVTYGWLYSTVEIPGTRVQRKSQGHLYSWRSPLMVNEKCNQANYYNGLVDRTMFCSGYRNGTHRSPCMGRVDGAPIICLNSDDTWEISGVRSYQPSCDSSWMAPSVYTAIYQHRRWIGDVVGNHLTV